MYFNNVYLSVDEYDYEYQKSHSYPTKFKVRINDAPWSPPSESKHTAELMATKNYLHSVGKDEEVRRAEAYTGHKRPTPMSRSMFRFGHQLKASESQELEYKSHRLSTKAGTPAPKEPYTSKQLRDSVRDHLLKYACAFLNAQLFRSPHHLQRQPSSIVFGVHDDRVIDGYFITEKERDTLEQNIHLRLSKLHGRFETDIEWQEVTYKTDIAYILKVSFTRSFANKQVFAVQNLPESPLFWIRKGPMVVAMTYEDIEEAFRIVNRH